MNKITKLTSSEIRDIMPGECANIADSGGLVMGGIQIATPSVDAWPSDADMEREAQALFGAVRLGPCDDSDDDVVTWVVVRA
ncbi:MAG: hypothetical protein EBR82_52100 [Caulobacteraceae bacterium]|nr:hypothetical protein [Caulobacteraceae bacterium]